MSAASTWYERPDPDGSTLAAVDAFRRRLGTEPDGVWAAPGRVNLVGEHVDYNEGLCLPFAIAHRTYVAVARRGDGVMRVWSQQEATEWAGPLDGVAPGTVPGWAGYVAGVPWALRRRGYDVSGVDVVVVGEVPRGAGLSSSAALECAVAVALDDLFGLGLGADDSGRSVLADACVSAENDIAGAPTGGLDQAAVLRCQPGHAILVDCRDFSVRQVPYDPAADGTSVLVMDTRAHHALVDGQYGERRSACERAARLLGVASLRDVDPADLDQAMAALPDDVLRRIVRHVVTELERVRESARLLDAGRAIELGPVLDASHRSLRDDFAVSCPELDLACSTATGAGALGARMTGGGFGGAAIALVPAGAEEHVADAVAAAFARAGYDLPAFLSAVPSAAASRQR